MTLSSAAHAQSGLDGILAPDPDATSAPQRSVPRQEQEPGYPGLIPGYIPETAPAPKPVTPRAPATAKPATPAIIAPPVDTARPQAKPTGKTGRQPPDPVTGSDGSFLAAAPLTPNPNYKSRSVSTLQDIKVAAMQLPRIESGPDYDFIEKTMQASLGRFMTEDAKADLVAKQPLFGGMSMTEYETKKSIGEIMEYVNDPRLTPAQRQKNAKAAESQLLEIAQTLNLRNAAPRGILVKVGVPAAYLDAETAAVNKSLTSVRQALNALAPYKSPSNSKK
jgi:hypothetical protein